jgi:threonylcarbamoyladenosine tRNA methylthiotransferase MtaB
MKRFPQVMPHFHLPLQSGSDAILRKMNRQYSSDIYRRMVDQLREAFNRPALTTDVIAGFPGESEDDFRQTIEMAKSAEFLHIHAFPFSPRDGTAAARWTKQMVPQRIATERMSELRQLSTELSMQFRSRFVGETVELLVEHPSATDMPGRLDGDTARVRHGRCARYFAVHFEADEDLTGQRVRVRVDRVTAHRTLGTLVG